MTDSTTKPEPKKSEIAAELKFKDLDERVTRFEEEKPDVAFKWHDHNPFEFFFLLTGFEEDKRYTESYIIGHAKATPAKEGPFPEEEWVETKIPLATRLELALNTFAEMKGLKDLSEFKGKKEQVFLIAYHGVNTHDDPHIGNTRIYSFYVEMVEEDGSRIALENWVI